MILMSANIMLLEPVTRAKCQSILAAWEEGMHPPIRVTHALRTFDEQLHLWQQGRMLAGGVWRVVKPSQVVTKAKPGSSAHNYGAAFDICFVGTDPYLHQYEVDNPGATDPLWEVYGSVVEKHGMTWGGRWPKMKDKPHAELADWKKYRDTDH